MAAATAMLLEAVPLVLLIPAVVVVAVVVAQAVCLAEMADLELQLFAIRVHTL